MLGRQERWQEDLFVAGPLRELVPDDHILKRVDRVLDLNWLRDEVKPLYDDQRGRPGIDPEAAVRLMLAGLLLGIVHDRKLMREAQVNIAIRWFAGYRLTEALPDHSSLTKIRQRWGDERFSRIFKKTVQQCMKTGLVKGDLVHVDATLIRADVSWESLVERHLDQVKSANEDDSSSHDDDHDQPPASELGGSKPSRTGKAKKYSPTDPDATLATSCKQYRMEPCYKQHTVVDDKVGVVLDVQVTTGEINEGRQLRGQLEQAELSTGRMVQIVTADGAYAHGSNFAMLEQRGTEAVIPTQKQSSKSSVIPARRFRYDARNHIVRCPAGRTLIRSSHQAKDQSWIYRGRTRDCQSCALRSKCISSSAKVRLIRIGVHQESLVRARRRHARWDERSKMFYQRHRWRSEGFHGEAKTCHGLRRAVRRRLWNVKIQAFLTAAAINLKRLAKALSRAWGRWWSEAVRSLHAVKIHYERSIHTCAVQRTVRIAM